MAAILHILYKHGGRELQAHFAAGVQGNCTHMAQQSVWGGSGWGELSAQNVAHKGLEAGQLSHK